MSRRSLRPIAAGLVAVLLLSGCQVASRLLLPSPGSGPLVRCVLLGLGSDTGGDDVLDEVQGVITQRLATLEVPASYRVQFETSKGNFTVQVDRSLAPNGADRFYRLISEGFYDGVRFFRVISGFKGQPGKATCCGASTVSSTASPKWSRKPCR